MLYKASWLLRSCPDRAVQFRAIALPLSTQVYNAGDNSAID